MLYDMLRQEVLDATLDPGQHACSMDQWFQWTDAQVSRAADVLQHESDLIRRVECGLLCGRRGAFLFPHAALPRCVRDGHGGPAVVSNG